MHASPLQRERTGEQSVRVSRAGVQACASGDRARKRIPMADDCDGDDNAGDGDGDPRGRA
jgi:hypothetical protein